MGEVGAGGKNPGVDGKNFADDGKDPGAGYGTEGQDVGMLDNMRGWRCSCWGHNWSSCDLQKQTEVKLSK